MQVFLTLLLTTLIFLGCDGTYENAPTKFEQAFSVSMAPAFAPGTVAAVPVNAQLILNASTTLNPATVNEKTIYLKDSSKIQHPISVSLSTQKIIISPKIYLKPQEQYEIVITTNIQTPSGEHLLDNIYLTFNSGNSTGDIDAPIYMGSNLSSGSATHPESIIYFQFDEPISPLIPSNIVTIQHPDTKEVITGQAYVEGTLLYFIPDTPLRTADDLLHNTGTDIGYDVNLSLANNISDLSGNFSSEPTIRLEVSGLDGAPSPSLSALVNNNNYQSGATVFALEHLDSTLFIGAENGLHICNYDLETKMFTPLSSLKTPSLGSIYAIRIDSLNKRLYLASSTGAYIVDIQDLSAPFLIGKYETSVPVYGLDYDRDQLFLAATLNGVIDLNISDISNPRLIKTYDTPGIVFDLLSTPSAGYGDYVSVADYQGGMKLLDPTYQSLQDGSLGSFAGQIRSILRDQNSTTQFLALSSLGGLFSFDLQSTPPPYLQTPINLSFPSYASKAISNTDKTAYINFKYLGIAIYNYQTAGQYDHFFKAPFEITTFTKIESSTKRDLVIVDPQGGVYAINANF